MNHQLTNEYQQRIRHEFKIQGVPDAEHLPIIIVPVPNGHYVGYMAHYTHQHSWEQNGLTCYYPIVLGSAIQLVFHNPLPITDSECSIPHWPSSACSI